MDEKKLEQTTRRLPQVSLEELTDRFHFHTPKDEKTQIAHQVIRHECFQLAKIIVEKVPPGREQELALTKLEEVMFWANAGIARSS